MVHTVDEGDPPEMKGKVRLFIPDFENEHEKIEIRLNVRPYLRESLAELKKRFQIVSFTASEQQYADAILDYIDPENNIFDLRLYRQHCVSTEFGHVKDLRIIRNRDIKDILIIDNNCLSFAFNINNGVPILPFYDNESDEELKHLTYYLKCLQESNVHDVRTHNHEAFGLLKLRDAFKGKDVSTEKKFKTELEEIYITADNRKGGSENP